MLVPYGGHRCPVGHKTKVSFAISVSIFYLSSFLWSDPCPTLNIGMLIILPQTGATQSVSAPFKADGTDKRGVCYSNLAETLTKSPVCTHCPKPPVTLGSRNSAIAEITMKRLPRKWGKFDSSLTETGCHSVLKSNLNMGARLSLQGTRISQELSCRAKIKIMTKQMTAGPS